MTMTTQLSLLTAVVAAVAISVLASPQAQTGGHSTTTNNSGDSGINKINHVIVIMQENRSFDHYFGTYPGADGIPANVCVPDPKGGACVKPYHDQNDQNGGGPHSERNAIADIDGGKMDGFQAQAEQGRKGCVYRDNPACSNSATPDVMGYHDGREIPNYWAYASNLFSRIICSSQTHRGACPSISLRSPDGRLGAFSMISRSVALMPCSGRAYRPTRVWRRGSSYRLRFTRGQT